MRTTQLPLPPATATNRVAQTPQVLAFARPPHDADYWGERMKGLDFTRSDHADTSRLNHVGLMVYRGNMAAGVDPPRE